jgi:potassium-transporting ATPase KdpC subunit
MRRDLVSSILGVVVLTILLGVAYPLVVTGIGKVAFPNKADGSMIKVDGKIVGSRLIGQDFRRDTGKKDKDGNPILVADVRYFQSRPSTATNYSADASAFTNLGPNSKDARDTFKSNLDTYLKLERPYNPGLSAGNVPIDAVTSSASGIDPQISVTNARIQAHRIAKVRGLRLATLDKLIDKYTDGRFIGVFGERGVNVLELNLALNSTES